MTKIVISFFIIINFLPVYAQWERVTAIPSPYDNAYYLDVYFLESNPLYGWACGRNGAVIRTDDGGQTWKGTIIPAGTQLESIYFVNEKVGYTSGLVYNSAFGGIFKSLDGGATWFEVSPPGQVSIWGNFFLDANTGLAIGGGCGPEKQEFWRTENGGASWSLFTLDFWESALSDLIIDGFSGKGYAVGSGKMYSTTDFGKTWSFYTNTGNPDWQEEITMYGRTFLLPFSTECLGNGGNGGARMSTDLGVTWNSTYFGNSMFGSFLHDDKRGWVVGWNRSVYYTSDAGKTWANRNCGISPGASLDDIWFKNDTTGYVVGEGVYKFVGDVSAKPEIAAVENMPVCNGDTVTLYSLIEYANYRWSTGEKTPSIKVTQPGIYTLWGGNTECDSATSLPFEVTFMPALPVTLNLSTTNVLCEGDTVYIDVSESYPNYLWNTGDTTQSIAATKTGLYSVSVTDEYGCDNSDSIKIEFMPNPEAEIEELTKTDICIGDSVWLQSRYIAAKYEWYKDSDINPFSQERKIYIKETGDYKLKTYNQNGCSSLSQSVNVVVRLDTNTFDFEFSTIKEFSLDSINFPNIICRKILVTSKSWKPQTIDNIYLYKNLSFSIPQSQLPIVLEPYGTFELEICYSPRNIDLERDTLYLNDRCWPHILPLIAKGVPNEYSSDSKCDVPLEFETIDIVDFGDILSGPPYPNPVTGMVHVPFKIFYTDSAPTFDIYLVDIYGLNKIYPKIEVLSSSEILPETTLKGEVNKKLHIENKLAVFNTDSLPNGVYLIIIQAKSDKVYKIIVNH